MKISYEPYPKGIWHSDCTFDNRSCPMKEVEREATRTLMECVGCGKRGYYTVGGVGCVNVEDVTPNRDS